MVGSLCILRTCDRHHAAGAARGCIPPTAAWHSPLGGSSRSFFVPRCRGRNGRGAGHHGGGLGVVQRPRATCGALPASIRSLSRGPWVPSATLLPATPSRHRGRPSVASRQRDRPAALNAATAGVRPLARGQSDHRGVQSLSRRQPLIGTGTGGLRGTPEHRPTPALQLSAASSPCLARPALSHRGSARRRCPPPLRGAGCRGTAGGQTGSGGRRCVGIAVRAGRPAAVN